ncbi:hypothetical protein NLJ89_g5346 [Agrocybe chaxingu]|uniref:Uncharacterized protein n=1 Tax=Agrocybe chaxingu TaxID=84603 RepID=A0A9W8MVN9_9AGAR|nr:hypothetical protein NLJ89_g5346 [Agrocybe chaxingu]
MAPRRRGRDQTIELDRVSESDSSTSSDSDSDSDTTSDVPRAARKAKADEEMRKALRDAQLKTAALEDELRKLKIERDQYRQSVKRLKKEKKATPKQEHDADADIAPSNEPKAASSLVPPFACYLDRIRLYAAKFMLMNEVFVPRAAFLVPRPDGARSDDEGQWKTVESAQQGMVAELFEEIPEDLHHLMTNQTYFRDQFILRHNEQRRTMIQNLRAIASEVFGRPSDLFSNGSGSQRGVDEVCLSLLFIGGKRPFSKYAPILFPDPDKRDMAEIFKNPLLALLLRALLFGPTSIRKGKKISNKPLARLWDVKTVTPAAIAFISVAAIFLQSPEETFTEVGKITGIGFGKLFAQFKSAIVIGLVRKQAKFIRLLQWYNAHVLHWKDAAAPRFAGRDYGGDESSGLEDCFKDNDDFEFAGESSFWVANDNEFDEGDAAGMGQENAKQDDNLLPLPSPVQTAADPADPIASITQAEASLSQVAIPTAQPRQHLVDVQAVPKPKITDPATQLAKPTRNLSCSLEPLNTLDL